MFKKYLKHIKKNKLQIIIAIILVILISKQAFEKFEVPPVVAPVIAPVVAPVVAPVLPNPIFRYISLGISVLTTIYIFMYWGIGPLFLNLFLNLIIAFAVMPMLLVAILKNAFSTCPHNVQKFSGIGLQVIYLLLLLKADKWNTSIYTYITIYSIIYLGVNTGTSFVCN